MAPSSKIPTSVLVALGLVGCTHSSVCLSFAPCLSDTVDHDTGDTLGACLSIAESGDSGQDTADTGCDSGDTGCEEPETSEALGRRGVSLADRAGALLALAPVLPDDVLARLKRE